MNEEHEKYEKMSNRGFYIALLLCIAVIAVSAWTILTVRNRRETEVAEVIPTDIPVWQDTLPEDVSDDAYDVFSPEDEELPSVTETLAEPESEHDADDVSAPEPEMEPTMEEPALPTVYLWPVVGEIEVPYSMDALTYNVTMSDWRTHDGVDILADAGTVVMAVSAGTVEQVCTDDLYGTMVVIDHGSGLKSCYANLQDMPNVAVGETVKAGQTIGAVGRTALCENGEPYHLHLAMSLNGQSVNPAEYLPEL